MEEVREFLKSRSTVNMLIVAANLAVYLILEMLGDTENAEFMLQHGASYTPYVVEQGKYYLLFTSMFLHFGLEHLFNNMLVLIFLGDVLEKKLGKWRYFLVYIGGGFIGNCVSVLMDLKNSEYYVSAGASGAVFAVIGALFLLVLKNKGKLDGISGRRLGIVILLSVFEGYTQMGVDNSAHIGGLIAGFCLCFVLSFGIGHRDTLSQP